MVRVFREPHRVVVVVICRRLNLRSSLRPVATTRRVHTYLRPAGSSAVNYHRVLATTPEHVRLCRPRGENVERVGCQRARRPVPAVGYASVVRRVHGRQLSLVLARRSLDASTVFQRHKRCTRPAGYADVDETFEALAFDESVPFTRIYIFIW